MDHIVVRLELHFLTYKQTRRTFSLSHKQTNHSNSFFWVCVKSKYGRGGYIVLVSARLGREGRLKDEFWVQRCVGFGGGGGGGLEKIFSKQSLLFNNLFV